MADKKTWPKPIEELLALHETFRRLGFEPQDLWVNFITNHKCVQFIVKKYDKEFSIIVAKDFDVQEMSDKWKEAAVWWNDEASTGEAAAIYAFSETAGRQIELIMALTEKGLLKRGKAI